MKAFLIILIVLLFQSFVREVRGKPNVAGCFLRGILLIDDLGFCAGKAEHR